MTCERISTNLKIKNYIHFVSFGAKKLQKKQHKINQKKIMKILSLGYLVFDRCSQRVILITPSLITQVKLQAINNS